MPVTPTKNRQCVTYGKPKDKFDTRQDAARRRDLLLNTGRYAPNTLGAFECGHCGSFHVGHRRIDAATRGGQRGGKKNKNGRRR